MAAVSGDRDGPGDLEVKAPGPGVVTVTVSSLVTVFAPSRLRGPESSLPVAVPSENAQLGAGGGGGQDHDASFIMIVDAMISNLNAINSVK